MRRQGVGAAVISVALLAMLVPAPPAWARGHQVDTRTASAGPELAGTPQVDVGTVPDGPGAVVEAVASEDMAPAPASVLPAEAASGTVAAEAPQTIGRVKVTSLAPGQAKKADASKAPPGQGKEQGRSDAAPGHAKRLAVKVAGREQTQRVGSDVLRAVQIASEQSGGDAAAQVEVDLGDVVGAVGGDAVARTQLVAMPACSLEDPQRVECQSRTTVESVREGARLISAQPLSLSQPMVLAAVATPSGNSGDFSKTSLSPAGSWNAGGQSGAFTYTYPFAAPKVAAGPAPSVGLSYNSQTVDGRTSATNNQASWVGDGWDLSAGFIERRYVPCREDGGTTNDLCWGAENATLSLDGHAGELVRQAGTNQWRLRRDDGTRLELLTGAGNGDNDGEHWVATTANGTKYYFGLGKANASAPESNATWTVPVFGNNAGEPGYVAGNFAGSSTVQAWRWNLDKVVDVHGNAMTLFYTAETNKYGANDATKTLAYTRGGVLSRIDYGQRAGSESPDTAAARMVFTSSQRCNGSSCAPLTAQSAATYPDVPFDQVCETATCAGRTAPTFFSQLRLSQVRTDVKAGDWTEVEHWSLTHTFPNPGDNSPAAMWLANVVHAVPGGATTETTKFSGTSKPNRVDGSSADKYQFGGPMFKFRVGSVTSPHGSVLAVAYSAPECVIDQFPDPKTNTKRCFPMEWAPPGIPARTHWFHKYVVTNVTQIDVVGSSANHETSYQYGAPAWGYDDDPVTASKSEDLKFNVWLGYDKVTTVVGQANTSQAVMKTTQLFHRGLANDHPGRGPVNTVDSFGTAVADVYELRGKLRETITYNGAAIVARETTAYEISAAKATNAAGRVAKQALVSQTVTATRLADGTDRIQSVNSSYDGEGFPIQIEDAGDTKVAGDEQCTKLTYARNTSVGIFSAVSAKQQRAVACGNWDSGVTNQHVMADERFLFDNLPWGQVKTGDVTSHERAEQITAGAISRQVDAKATYDQLGRVTSATDAAGHTTKTAYTPAGMGIPAQVTVTSPDPDGTGGVDPHVSVTVLDPRWGRVVKQVAPGNLITEASLDAWGRVSQVWLPGRDRAASPSQTFEYTMSTTKGVANAVTTKTLLPAGASYSTSVELLDGLLRPIQTQTQTDDHVSDGSGAVVYTPGRLITNTVYDGRGLATAQRGPVFAAGAPSATIATFAETTNPKAVRTNYDGAGRPVEVSVFANDQLVKTTTTIYGGDRVTVVPPAGGVPQTTITDVRGRTSSIIRYRVGGLTPEGALTSSFTYTPRGDLASMTDPSGIVWGYEYDLLGRQIKLTDPDSGTLTRTWDRVGNLIASTDGAGKTNSFTYDALGRKTSQAEGPSGTTPFATWSYDTTQTGKLAHTSRTIAGKQITTDHTWDGAGRPLTNKITVPEIPGLIEAPLAGSYATTEYYHPNGASNGQDLPAAGPLPAEQLEIAYDEQGRAESLRGLAPYVFGIDYVARGLVSRWTSQQSFGKAMWATYRYDETTDELLNQGYVREGQAAVDVNIDYERDRVGHLTKIATTFPASKGAADVQCVARDGFARMSQWWTPASGDCAAAPSVAGLGGPATGWQSWTWDSSERLSSSTTHKSGGDVVDTFTYPAAGAERPHAASSLSTKTGTGTAVSKASTYDKAGRLTKQWVQGGLLTGHTGGDQTLTWDGQGQLASSVTGGATTTYAYDVDGNRLVARNDQTTTLFLGSTTLILDRASGQVRGERTYRFNGATVAVRTGAGPEGWRHVWSELNGTTGWQVNPVTQAFSARRTGPFGAHRGAKASTWVGHEGFVGGWETDQTGLVRVGARELDPGKATFIAPDPLLDAARPHTWNPYTYGAGDPWSNPDPTGLAFREMIDDGGGTDGHGTEITKQQQTEIYNFWPVEETPAVFDVNYWWGREAAGGEGAMSGTQAAGFVTGVAGLLDLPFAIAAGPHSEGPSFSESIASLFALGGVDIDSPEFTSGWGAGEIFGGIGAGSVTATRWAAAGGPAARGWSSREWPNAYSPIWSRGRGRGSEPKLPPGTNAPQMVGDRMYSGHALDRMQERGLMPSVIEDAIDHGTSRPGSTPGTVVYTSESNNVQVVIDSDTKKVVTVI